MYLLREFSLACYRNAAVRTSTPAFAAATLLALTACGGGGGSTPPTGTPTSTPTSTPSSTPTASGSAIAVSPDSTPTLSFDALAGPAQTVSVTQANNSAGFTLSTNDCTGVASVAESTGFGPFAFSALGVGSCTYIVTGANAATAKITIAVTTTGITVQSSQRAQ